MNSESVNKKEILSKITSIVDKEASELGLEVVEVDFSKVSGQWYLKIFIYRKEPLVNHEDCVNLTKSIEKELDEEIPVQYHLEVSSPGADRKIKSSKEYVIFKGQNAKIKLKQPLEDNLKVFSGTIIDYSQEKGLEFKLKDADKVVFIKENNISSAKLEPDYKF